MFDKLVHFLIIPMIKSDYFSVIISNFISGAIAYLRMLMKAKNLTVNCNLFKS